MSKILLRVTYINRDLKEMKTEVNSLREAVSNPEEEIQSIKSNSEHFANTWTTDEISAKVDDLENCLRRDNLVYVVEYT